MESLQNLLPGGDNPVFAGGIGLAVIAAGAQIARNGYQVGIRMLRRQFLVTMEVTSKDRSFPWVLNWLSIQSGARTQHLSVETITKPAAGTSFRLVHGPGQHLLNYNGRYILVQRTREQQMVDLNSGKPWEKVVFTSYGRDISIFQKILQDSYNLTASLEEGKTSIYTNWGSEWRQFGQPRVKRSVDSVVLDVNIREKLVEDVIQWMNASTWYRERGIPYRRGYLLYGPPGSGKSSFIYALAGKLNYNICILNLNERGLTDDRLALALSNIPPHSIVLLEDIDAAFPIQRDTNSHQSSSYNNHNSNNSDVTFSGLLNVLDGVAAR
jgi:mitochondrial chaperone BCS1